MAICRKCGLENGLSGDCEEASDCVLLLKRHVAEIENVNNQLFRLCQAQNDMINQANTGYDATQKILEEKPIQRTFERSFFDFSSKAEKAHQAFERIREQNEKRVRAR